MSHSKFKECVNVNNVDQGQIILAAQQMVQKAQVAVTSVAGTSVALVSKSEFNIPLNNQISSSSNPISGSNVIKQPIQPKIPNFALTNDNSSESSELIKIGLPYPNNLRVEKRSETSLLVKWDAPTAAISLNQSVDGDNITGSFDPNEIILLQGYNIYLNHEHHSVTNASEDRVAILENIELSVVCFEFNLK